MSFSDFECKLDKHLKPLSYIEPSTLKISDRGKVHWDTSSLENIRDELPTGAQRYGDPYMYLYLHRSRILSMLTSSLCLFLSVAVDFLDSKYFCKNTHHMKGEALMRKRHLEILGYRVVQVRQFYSG